MKSLEGVNISSSTCFLMLKEYAADIAFAVQLPSSPWSKTGMSDSLRSTFGGSSVGRLTSNRKSLLSGRSGFHPYMRLSFADPLLKGQNERISESLGILGNFMVSCFPINMGPKL